jgi:hypothetical protein
MFDFDFLVAKLQQNFEITNFLSLFSQKYYHFESLLMYIKPKR